MEPDAPVWHGELVDLDAYLERVGHTGGLEPTLATLRALHSAHVRAIPFENVDPVLGRPVRLDLPSLEEKLVRGGRGGYCYEHVTLYAAVLERLGFGVTGLSGRVRVGLDHTPPPRPVRRTTHALLRVTARDSQVPWLSDVGFGASPLVPLELADGARTSAGGWTYRLQWREVTPGAHGWMLYVWEADGEGGGRWFDRHSTVPVPQYPVDYETGSHFVGTHPRSPFTARPFAQRVADDRLDVLDGTSLSAWRPSDGADLERRALTPAEVPQVLREVFRVRLTAADAAALRDRAAAGR